MQISMESLAEKFHSRYIPVPEAGCWIWTGSASRYGLMVARASGVIRGAHRVSWELHKGPIPAGMNVCHRCDTPLCVNPDHLFLGNDKDNHQDRARKGRSANRRGERNTLAVLTDAQVLAIRGDGRPQRVIAAEYGVCQQSISDIRAGRRWSHVGGQVEVKEHACGEAHRSAKLTEAQVRAIRCDPRSNNHAVAKDYGISRALVGKIRRGQAWRHVA